MRALLAALLITGIVALAVLIAEQPGHVAIAWRDWRLDPSVPVLIGGLVVLFLVLLLLIAMLRALLGAPLALARRRRERRRHAGYRALTQGMVAVAAGDAEEAQRQARKADVLLAEPPLTLLLSAQAAQLQGDEDAARRYFAEMLNRPETEFLGLRGLVTQALRRGDEAAALRLAERAHRLRPQTPWVVTALLDLRVRAGDWAAAQETLGEATRMKLLAGAETRHQEAAILHERAQREIAAERPAAALALLARAQEASPGLAPAAALRARLSQEAGKIRQAVKAIETAWRAAPHPALVKAYLDLTPDAVPLARVKRVETLARANPDHAESHIAIAEAALAAQLWGEARRHLEAAGARGAESGVESAGAPPPTARICRLMAELETAEHGDAAAGRAWLARAAVAAPDPLYVCRDCAAESHDWHALCPRCRAFASLRWRSPDRPAAALEATPAARLPAPLAPTEAPDSAHALGLRAEDAVRSAGAAG